MTVNEFYKQPLPEFESDDILWKRKGKGMTAYLPDFSTFDTEVSNLTWTIEGKKHGVGLLYLWQICIFGKVVTGRYLEEFVELVQYLKKHYGLGEKKRMVVYVHNLEYDYQFIKSYFDKWQVFATAPRAVLYAYTNGLEFRCSYKLTNMGLAKFLESEGTIIQKQTGYDYNKLRTPRTVLTPEEMKYGEFDVIGLYQGIKSLMKKNDDNIVTIPMTSTGYVRRDCRAAMNSNKKNREQFVHCRLTDKQYELCRKAFRGGNTHANRKYTGMILEDLQSFDIASSYPAVLLYNEFPCSPPQKVAVDEAGLLDIMDKGLGFIAEIVLYDVETTAPIPYLALDKCEVYDILDMVNDNGRILKSKKLKTWAVDQDYKIITKQYNYSKCEVRLCYKWRLSKLPKELREVISKYFVKKTLLKGIEGEEYYYNKSKNKLNGCYGMMVQDPVREAVYEQDGEWHSDKVDVFEALEHFYKSRNNFLQYQIGIYVTAYARARLQEAIEICGDNIVYCDTDSVKFLRSLSISTQIMDINRRVEQWALASDVSAIEYTKAGEKQVLGLWDEEKPYERFITYGAKKYAYDQLNKKGEVEFHITVSGLGKGAAKEIGCIENFRLGLTVTNSGRTISEYDDNINPHFVWVDDYEYEIRSNICIIDTTYTLGVTEDYYNLSEFLKNKYERVKAERWTYRERI